MEIEILHHDDDFLVCRKPHGVESEKQLPTLLCQQLALPKLYPVHRLDKETQGVMVFAKTPDAAAFFSMEIQQNRWQKIYRAVVKGCPPTEEDTLTDLLFRDRQKNKSYPVKRMRKGVKQAELSYRVLTPFEQAPCPHTLVEIELKTGRTHQIRVQFASRGMPLLGDKKYGGEPYPHLCLTAVSLTLTTPQGRRVTYRL